MDEEKSILGRIRGNTSEIAFFCFISMIASCQSCLSNQDIENHLKKIEHSIEKLETKK